MNSYLAVAKVWKACWTQWHPWKPFWNTKIPFQVQNLFIIPPSFSILKDIPIPCSVHSKIFSSPMKHLPLKCIPLISTIDIWMILPHRLKIVVCNCLLATESVVKTVFCSLHLILPHFLASLCHPSMNYPQASINLSEPPVNHLPTKLVKIPLTSLLPLSTDIIHSSLTSSSVTALFKTAIITPVLKKDQIFNLLLALVFGPVTVQKPPWSKPQVICWWDQTLAW